MNLAVIIPVGPGHSECAVSACHSVLRASTGPFSKVVAYPVNDLAGKLGRSAARNAGMDKDKDADWYFFLDADDEMEPKACDLAAASLRHHDAVFGAVCRQGVVTRENMPVESWDDLMTHGSRGTLSMGAFFRAEPARELGFHPMLDAGEDFEFYYAFLAGHSFRKIREPLVTIGSHLPPAGGPRGYDTLDWNAACEPFRAFWQKRGRIPLPPEERAQPYWRT